jgi:hypothetical protein
MPVTSSVMAQIIREGMDHYWRVVYSVTDEGLDATEIEWKREYERDMRRLDEKFGAQFDLMFGNKS